MIRSMLLMSAAMALLSLPVRAETLMFQTKMEAQTEVPPKASQGSGTVAATLDTATKKLDYTASWSGLTGPATMAHFHGPAAVGANAGVAVAWPMNPTSPLTGSATLTDAQMADLIAGKWYANVHTAQNPGGEIRGQMTKE